MRPNPAARKFESLLAVLPFPGLLQSLSRIPCPHCSSRLTLHQPDVESADRLLGVCEGCKRWHLVDLLPDCPDGILTGLPDREVVRALSRADPSGGISLMGPEPDPGPPRKPGK